MEHYTLEFNEDNLLILKPVNKLSDEQYDRLKPVIENMGGHWREKIKGFIFHPDKSHLKAYTDRNEELQFFPTPKSVADRLVELSGINQLSAYDMPKVLEPSAGTGDLLDALPSWVKPSLYVVEPDNINAEILKEKGYWMVDETTFEDFYKSHKKLKNSLDYVVMNPPFSGSRDVLHTMMAYEFLKKGGTLVAIISENALYYENKHSDKFRDWVKATGAYIESIPYGAFRESGTNVDTVIVKVTKK